MVLLDTAIALLVGIFTFSVILFCVKTRKQVILHEHSLNMIRSDLKRTNCDHILRIDKIVQYEQGVNKVYTDIYFMCDKYNCDLKHIKSTKDLRKNTEEWELYTKFLKLKH